MYIQQKNMTSVATVNVSIGSPRKRSKHDLHLIEEEQQKINQMMRGFYDKTKGKLTKALTKCENKNTLLCKQLFDTLALHPNQELYETARLHDLIFNEIDLIGQAVADFVKKLDTLQERLSGQVALQQVRSEAKKERAVDKGIAVLRKVSFKREKHALKQRLLSIDTVNRKLLKCEGMMLEGQQQKCFRFDIEGKTAEPNIFTYSKIWFQSKRREYLFCLGSQQSKTQFYLLNDKLQTITIFPHPVPALDNLLSIVQLGTFLYLLTPHQVTRLSMLNQGNSLSKYFSQRIVGGQAYQGGVILWVRGEEGHHSIIFLDSELQLYCQTELKLNVQAVPLQFKLNDTLYFITRTYTGLIELLKLEDYEVMLISEVGALQEVIPVRVGNKTEEIIFRMTGNKFMKLGKEETLIGLQVDIESGELIRNCAVLGEHFYALCENGKTMLECHYVPPHNPENL